MVAGAGLTGGATSGSATVDIGAGTGIVVNANDVAVDVGTADGKIVQVQAGGKLPALDGSDLTNLDAGDIASGTLPIARGGTGQVTANAALNALLPTQATNSGKVLQTDGTNTSWVTPATGSGTVSSVTSANSYLSVATTTTTPVITANVGTAANTLAAGDDARITGALQTSVYDADVLPAASCTNLQTPYWSSVGGTWACQAIGSVPATDFSGSLVGDVSGTQTATSVDKIKGKAIAAATATNQIMIYNGTSWVNNILSGDATMDSTGAVTLKNTGTAGTYYKVTTDAQGRVTSGSALASGDITTALSYTPVNKAGDTMTGTLNLASNGLVAGTSQLVISGGSVGINTASPSASYKLDVNGDVRATGFFYASDRRLKENFEELKGLETVLKLHGVKFDWKEDGRPDVGLIAQEVEKVLPQLVMTDPTTGLKAVKYGNLVAPLIESTKELYGMCSQLKVESTEQKRRISSLEERLDKMEKENEELKQAVKILLKSQSKK